MMIDINLINEALQFYNINNQEYLNKCYECIEFINKNDELRRRMNDVYNVLYKDKSNKIMDLWNLKNMDKLFGNIYHPFVTTIVLLRGYKIHLYNMEKYKLDEEQCTIHKRRIKECLTRDIYERKYDGIRISQMIWGTYFINLKLIEVEGFQYEITEHNPITQQKQSCIKIHIPRGTNLSIDKVKESLNKSKVLIEKYFNLYNPKYYCISWILSNEVRNMLDTNSNISKFYDMFEIIHGKECIDDVLNFVFKLKECNNYNDLAENTSLQRKIKQFLIQGNSIRLGMGILK